MRIISGKKRGLKLLSPMDYSVRPTTDKIKESIFNILFEIGESSVVLDLFCGSGAIGIEFLSRGAEKVYFCDFSDMENFYTFVEKVFIPAILPIVLLFLTHYNN